MQAQAAPPAPKLRLDLRSLMAASLCLLAPFLDALGWVFVIAGIFLLRRATFGRRTKWLLAAVAILPKILFAVVRSLRAPTGLSFTIEPHNPAVSSSFCAWSILLVAIGLFFIFGPRQRPQVPGVPVPRSGREFDALAALGLVPILIAAVMLLGLLDGFHRIDDAGQGRWALTHAARGTVATFAIGDVAVIDSNEIHSTRGSNRYSIRIVLSDGRTFKVTTTESASLDELRKFAATSNLRAGKLRFAFYRRSGWTNGGSGFTLKDCVGTYESAVQNSPLHSAYEFWLDGDRLAGKETTADSRGKHVRILNNIKINDSGEVEFQRANYLNATKEDKYTHISLAWSPQGDSGRFVRNGLEVGGQKFIKH